MRRLQSGLRLAAEGVCRGEAEAVSGEDGGRLAVASGDPGKGLVVEAHVGGGDNFAVRLDPDQIAADDVW